MARAHAGQEYDRTGEWRVHERHGSNIRDVSVNNGIVARFMPAFALSLRAAASEAENTEQRRRVSPIAIIS